MTIVAGWVASVRAKDVDGMMRGYSPDVVAFDVVTPLQSKGIDAIRRRSEEWTSSFQGPIDYDVRDLQVDANDDIAFARSLNHVRGTAKGGEKVDMWVRATVCFRKADGAWLVTHEHVSVPFHADSGKVAFDAKP